MASATSNTIRQLGSVFGIAVLGTIVTNRFTDLLHGALGAMGLPAFVVDKVEQIASQGGGAAAGAGVSAPPGIDVAAIKTAVGVSFTSAMHTVLWICGILVLTGVPVALAMIRRPSAPTRQPTDEAERAHVDAAAAGSAVPQADGGRPPAPASDPGVA
jgi:hypothetical protein